MQPVAQIDWWHPKSLVGDDLESQPKQLVHQVRERLSNVVADLQQYPSNNRSKYLKIYKYIFYL